jgi:hypothetical protein
MRGVLEAVLIVLVLLLPLSGCGLGRGITTTYIPPASTITIPATSTATETIQSISTTTVTIPLASMTSTAPASTTPAVSSPIPSVYAPLYTELNSDMSGFENTLKLTGSTDSSTPVFATELAYADGNTGPGLLTSQNMQNNILMLDSLQAMGVKGVVLAIKFPLLSPDFPQSADYLQFYKNIMSQCRARGMKVLVECGAIFAGTPYSPVQVNWSGYTTQTYLQGVQDQLVLISQQIKPDYLSLCNEPDTEENLTGLTITPADWSNFVSTTLSKLDRSGGMLVGAGAGTWDDPAYIDGLMNIPGLDFIDLHIYPFGVNDAYLQRAIDWAQQAHAAGKRVTVSECWLYKESAAEMTAGSSTLGNAELIMDRDFYSFWEPLDARFMGDMMTLAQDVNMDFMSFFWTRNFYSYLDYSPNLSAESTTQLNSLINQAAFANLQQGLLSPLGTYFSNALMP